MQKIEQVKELVASGLAQTAREALAMIEKNKIKFFANYYTLLFLACLFKIPKRAKELSLP